MRVRSGRVAVAARQRCSGGADAKPVLVTVLDGGPGPRSTAGNMPVAPRNHSPLCTTALSAPQPYVSAAAAA